MMSKDVSHELSKESVVDIINDMYSKYSDNPYMITKIQSHIQQLPLVLENAYKNRTQRQQRIDELTFEQNSFIQSFLSHNQYFYVNSTEHFFYYDGKHYKLYNEDDILYQILSTITMDKHLMSWKQRTKVYIMKRIKENSLLKSVPESYTIQNVLNQLYPHVFATKDEAKYFLTVLGDNIFKKNNDITHFVNVNAKHFIRELNTMCQGFFGTNACQTIKHKYHEHNYQQCRIITVSDGIKNESLWKSMLNNYALDILCVACHYSIRFQNSDAFLSNSMNDELTTNVCYLKNNTPESMMNSFTAEYLSMESNRAISSETQITWKNMQYLWKHFLESRNLPTVIFQQTLKTMLIQKLDNYYKEDTDTFAGICSKFLPTIQKFIHFWDETVVVDENECENDFEISEILLLFRLWSEERGESLANFNHKQLLDVITYFYPEVEIESEKYIFKIRSNMWNKQETIQSFIESISISPVSSYEAYLLYWADCNEKKTQLIVSKSYFEKYFVENCSQGVL
jgi:hypothetical protein